MAATQVPAASWGAPCPLHLRLKARPPSAAFQQLLPTIRLPHPVKARPVHRWAVSSSGKYIRENYLVKKVSGKEVYDLVQGKRNVPLIIDFYATWCGPCILMAQDLEMINSIYVPDTAAAATTVGRTKAFDPPIAFLAVEYENSVLIVKVDTDDEYEFARDMQVRGLPTLFFVSPDASKDAIRTEGLIPIEMMKKIIETEM